MANYSDKITILKILAVSNAKTDYLLKYYFQAKYYSRTDICGISPRERSLRPEWIIISGYYQE